MRTALALSVGVVGVACLASGAAAAITGFTGSAFQIGSPVSCLPTILPTGNQVFVWDEQQGVTVTGLPVELSINPSNTGSPTSGLVSGLLDSHFIHYDHFGQANGTVTFALSIVGVAYIDTSLDVSDAVTGSLGTAYPTSNATRGAFSLPFLNDFIDINGNVLTFKIDTISPVNDFTQIRVYTKAVPAPGTIALLTAGGLLTARRRRA